MPGLRIHYFQHIAHEGLGSIENWALQRGHRITCTRFFADDSMPMLDDIDWLIVMGGTMGVYEDDRHPWLRAEWTFIRSAIDAGKTVLGICLGSQLIARALGAEVYVGPAREIGWLPVTRTDAGRDSPLLADMPDTCTVLQWHGDTFDLPAGAQWLATSPAVPHQAFSYGERVLALQFHLEATAGTVRDFVDHDGESGQIREGGQWVQSAADLIDGSARYGADNNRLMSQVLDRLAAAGAGA